MRSHAQSQDVESSSEHMSSVRRPENRVGTFTRARMMAEVDLTNEQRAINMKMTTELFID